MKTASKLALLCAMALAAVTVASASALATTVRPEGAYTATEDGRIIITMGTSISITCTASTASGTVDNTNTPSRMTIDTLTLDSCQNVAAACTVIFDALPAQLDVNVEGDGSGAPSARLTNINTESATMTCGAPQCTLSVDTTLEAELYDGSPGQLAIVGQDFALTFACGSTGTFDGTWTIDTTGNGTSNSIDVSA